MLNKVILMGRITQELELKQTTNRTAVLSFNVAVDRSYTPSRAKRSRRISSPVWHGERLPNLSTTISARAE